MTDIYPASSNQQITKVIPFGLSEQLRLSSLSLSALAKVNSDPDIQGAAPYVDFDNALEEALRIVFPEATVGPFDLPGREFALAIQLSPKAEKPWHVNNSCIVRVETNLSDARLTIRYKAVKFVEAHIVDIVREIYR